MYAIRFRRSLRLLGPAVAAEPGDAVVGDVLCGRGVEPVALEGEHDRRGRPRRPRFPRGGPMAVDLMRVTAALNAYPWTRGTLTAPGASGARYCAVGRS